jgi:hypothetical protein
MAYENDTATDPVDLLKKLVTFLAANGWTTDYSDDDTHGNSGHTSHGWRAHLHRSGVYVNLRAMNNEQVHPFQPSNGYGMCVFLGTGYNAASTNEWFEEPGGPIGTGDTKVVGSAMNLPSGAIAGYHFFANDSGDNIVVVVEKSGGLFVHIGWGLSIDTAGSITGGQYFFGSSSIYSAYDTAAFYEGHGLTARMPMSAGNYTDSISFVKCDVDTFTGKWLSGGSNTSGTLGYTGKIFNCAFPSSSGPANEVPNYYNFSDRQTSVLNSMANLLPQHVYAQRDGGGYSIIGTVPHIFYTNAVGRGFAAGADYLLGADTYKIFTNFAVRKTT